MDQAVLRRARIRAVSEGTSVNALVRDFVKTYADGNDQRDRAMARFLELAGESGASSGPEGRTWTRDSLYDR
jgi:hypothetical protein